MKRIFIFLIIYYHLSCASQTQIDKINTESFENFANTYNYTFWNSNWKTSGATRGFTIQTSSFILDIDYTNLKINNLIINKTILNRNEALNKLLNEISIGNYSGDIDYGILQNNTLLYAKSSTPTSEGKNDCQAVEFGTWFNRRFVSTNFTNNAPISKYYTGIEFAAWHNRLKLTFHVKPTATINNASLQFSITIPSQYKNLIKNDSIFIFSEDNNSYFIVKGSKEVQNIYLSNNKITVTSEKKNLEVDSLYQISIIFYFVKNSSPSNYEQILNQESPLNMEITVTQELPNNTDKVKINFDATDGLYYLDIPRYTMGYNSPTTLDVMQNIKLSISNSSNISKRVRLCFRQIPNVNVVGFNSLLRNYNGDPSGFPLQVSKDWHTGNDLLFSGSWIREYTEIIVPANTILNVLYTRTGAKWGETFSVSSHQLSVVGTSLSRGGWLEAAYGSFGENITHSPDYELGSSNACDFRPFLVTDNNYGGTSSQYSWTGNFGGLDIGVYYNEANKKIYQSEVKTEFSRYSPNLTETTVATVSSDKKLKINYTFYLNRTDDYNRVYYKIKIKALQNTSFSRFDIFQLGGDIYNMYTTRKVVYGNENGIVGEFLPTNDGSNNYTTDHIPLEGNNPWIWAGDGYHYNDTTGYLQANMGMIIRYYKANLNGEEYSLPYFRERSSSLGFSSSYGTNPTSYCIVPPPGVTSFNAGDSITLFVEVILLPKQYGDYYGPNKNFAQALKKYGNSYYLVLREAKQNKIVAFSPTNQIDTIYPLKVYTTSNNGYVIIKSGLAYIPIVFKNLTSVTNPTLSRAIGNGWELVDQSVHGKDFWQANYIPETNTFDLIFNINQDGANDSSLSGKYYLGDSPPIPSIYPIIYINNDSLINTNLIDCKIGDKVIIDPKVFENGVIYDGKDVTWKWSGPNGFSSTNRILKFDSLYNNQVGTYTLEYNDIYGFKNKMQFTINVETSSIKRTLEQDVSIYPNPFGEKLYYRNDKKEVKLTIYNKNGTKILPQYITEKSGIINTSQLKEGIYFIEIRDNTSSKILKFYKKNRK